jgi:hypothetical protein
MRKGVLVVAEPKLVVTDIGPVVAPSGTLTMMVVSVDEII